MTCDPKDWEQIRANQVSASAQVVMDKLERGQMPTVRELRAAELCLHCSGFGYIYLDDGDHQTTCHKCGGDGKLRDRKV